MRCSVTAPAKGDGSAANPYQISNGAELNWVARLSEEDSTGKCFEITEDIYLNNPASTDITYDANGHVNQYSLRQWPSGGVSNYALDAFGVFAGNIDGQGYTVFGLNNTWAPNGNWGLFGTLGGGATVKNINIDSAYYKRAINSNSWGWSNTFAAGIAGDTAGGMITIENCTVYRSTITEQALGWGNYAGILARNRGYGSVVIKNCGVDANISTEKNGMACGGLIGDGWTSPVQISDSWSNVYPAGNNNTNGGAGATFTNCYTFNTARCASVTGEVPEGITVVEGSVKGDDAKTTFPNFDWENDWQTVEGANPIPRYQEDTETEAPQYYTYEVTNGEATITAVDPSISGDVIIPSTLGGYPVTSIRAGAFVGCESLTSINIPNSVTNIGDGAFSSCYSLASINIPDSVVCIGDDVFSECWSLDSIYIPKSVTSIGSPIGRFSSITRIDVDSENIAYCSLDGVLFNKDKTKLLCYPAGRCYPAYKYEPDVAYNIPDSVRNIGDYAFHDCGGLEKINVPNGVTSIGYSAFWGCGGIVSINIPDSVTSIGEEAFFSCGIESITIPGGVAHIKAGTFYGCGDLKTINILEGVSSIDRFAFESCISLKKITIPKSVSSISQNVFLDCDNVVIHGYAGSCAETYATENNIPFVKIVEKNFVNSDTGVSYESFADMMNEAKSGETVKIFADVDDSAAAATQVKSGVTLDLNGHYITAANFLSFGKVIDTGDGKGGIVISRDTSEAFTLFQPDNEQMPLYDNENGCYRLFAYEVKTMMKKLDGQPLQFGFKLLFNNDMAYSLIENVPEDLTLKIKIDIFDGTKLRTVNYECNSKVLAEYAGVAAGNTSKLMILSVYGTSTLKAGDIVTATPTLTSITSVTRNGNSKTFTK